MADQKKLLTQDLPVPAGVVLTPDYEVVPAPDASRPRYADRRIDARGEVLHPSPDGSYDHLSTYGLSKAEAAKVDAANPPLTEHSGLAAQQG
jgi:hypothetical protein